MLLPISDPKWSNRLAFDVALRLEGSGEPIEDILKAHSLDPLQFLQLSKDPIFLRRVEDYRTEIRTKGITFRLKARAQAEELLTTSFLMIHDPAVSPAVKADLIKSTVKWAGLEPKGDESPAGTSGGVAITINLGGQDHQLKLVETTNDTIENSTA